MPGYRVPTRNSLQPGGKTGWRCCQSNANRSPFFADKQVLSDEKIAPLAKGGVAFLFEADSRVDVPFQIEVIVY